MDRQFGQQRRRVNEVPDRKFKMTMSFRRNTDLSLPASHTAELTFILPPDFPGGGVANVPGILMKSNEQARGTPLGGLAVKVTDGFFLVGLSNVDADRSRNVQLLKERSWFDVPQVYTNQRRAVIAIEKGRLGEQAFNDAFEKWSSGNVAGQPQTTPTQPPPLRAPSAPLRCAAAATVARRAAAGNPEPAHRTGVPSPGHAAAGCTAFYAASAATITRLRALMVDGSKSQPPGGKQ